MAQVSRTTTYRVDIMEFERGWGSRVDEILYFDNEAEALRYVTAFNAVNTAPTAPDWYMVAEYCGRS